MTVAVLPTRAPVEALVHKYVYSFGNDPGVPPPAITETEPSGVTQSEEGIEEVKDVTCVGIIMVNVPVAAQPFASNPFTI